VTEKIPPEYRQEIENCFKSMSGVVHGFLRRLTRGDKELSEDLVQETFQEAAQSWHELRGLTEEERKAWLISVAFNTATDVFRRSETAREKWPLIRERYMPAETDMDRQVITSMAIQRFIEVIDAMPPMRRIVAFLFWRCGWRNHEIAEALGITAGRVTQQLEAARQTLERELSQYVPFDSSKRGGNG
jgi:RNA polymerase sigma factor (sigma-70 family)